MKSFVGGCGCVLIHCWSSILTVLVFGVYVLLVVCVVHCWIEWVKYFKVCTYYYMEYQGVVLSQRFSQ